MSSRDGGGPHPLSSRRYTLGVAAAAPRGSERWSRQPRAIRSSRIAIPGWWVTRFWAGDGTVSQAWAVRAPMARQVLSVKWRPCVSLELSVRGSQGSGRRSLRLVGIHAPPLCVIRRRGRGGPPRACLDTTESGPSHLDRSRAPAWAVRRRQTSVFGGGARFWRRCVWSNFGHPRSLAAPWALGRRRPSPPKLHGAPHRRLRRRALPSCLIGRRCLRRFSALLTARWDLRLADHATLLMTVAVPAAIRRRPRRIWRCLMWRRQSWR